LDYAYHLAASDITSEQQKKIEKCQYCERKAKLLSLSALAISEKKNGFRIVLFWFSAFLKNATALLVQVQDKNKTVKLIR